jgi:uncharacterized tellurite resistance protein B-like protein
MPEPRQVSLELPSDERLSPRGKAYHDQGELLPVGLPREHRSRTIAQTDATFPASTCIFSYPSGRLPRFDRERTEKGRTMDEELRRKVCRLIAGIVVSDEDLSPQEDVFVDRMLERFGIPKAEREVIFPIIDASEAATAVMELPAEVRSEAFGLLIEAAAIDGSIAPEELGYLETVADAINVSRDDLSDKLSEALKKAKAAK